MLSFLTSSDKALWAASADASAVIWCRTAGGFGPDITNPFFAGAVRGIESVCGAASY